MRSKGFSIRDGVVLKDELIDDVIYLDTNIGYALALHDSDYRDDIINFIERVNNSGKILVRSSHFLFEFHDSMYKAKLNEEAKKFNGNNYSNLSLKDASKLVPNENLLKIKKETENGANKILSVLDDYSIEIDFNDSEAVRDAITLDSQSPHIHFADSKHVAIAQQHEINSILTTDGGFIHYDNLNIYSPVRGIHNDFMSKNHESLNTFKL